MSQFTYEPTGNALIDAAMAKINEHATAIYAIVGALPPEVDEQGNKIPPVATVLAVIRKKRGTVAVYACAMELTLIIAELMEKLTPSHKRALFASVMGSDK
jgi:hypothetical protein